MPSREPLGRVGAVSRLRAQRHPSISIGSKDTRLADLNVDIDRSNWLDIVASVLYLPLRDRSFEEVLFTDVIEHVPKGAESEALRELRRILKPGGRLLLSTPNREALFTILDPAFHLRGHRHYTVEQVWEMLEKAEFKVQSLFTAGGPWALINTLWYSFVTFPTKRFLWAGTAFSPMVLAMKEDKEYAVIRPTGGYTIFAIAISNRATIC